MAIAIVFSMVYYRVTGRDCSWIIILSAYAPDIDYIVDSLLGKVGVTVLLNTATPFGMVIFFLTGIQFRDSFTYASIGFAAHMVSSPNMENLDYT